MNLDIDMQSLCGTNCCSQCSHRTECGGCQNIKGHPLGKSCIAAECIEQDGKNGFLRFKARLISEINALEIKGLAKGALALSLISIISSYVSMAVTELTLK